MNKPLSDRLCLCGKPARLFQPGRQALYAEGMLIVAGIADRNRCLEHGLPWRVVDDGAATEPSATPRAKPGA